MKTLLGLTLLFVTVAAQATTDYERDLALLKQQAEKSRNDPTMYAAIVYRHASITADFAELHEAEQAIEEALRAKPSPDLVLLRANFNFKMHRLGRAKEDLAQLADGGAGEPVKTLAAQIAMQEGDYAAAHEAYQAIADKTQSWDSIASLAYYESVTGHPDRADRLYLDAEEELSAKEMRAYAWVEVQRGVLDFDRGRYADALVHYQRASRAYSGYWLVDEHMAEVLDKLGRTAQSVALYRTIIESTHNPEYVGALAAIVGRTDPVEAARLDAEALSLYDRQLALYPEAAGGHFIRHLLLRGDAQAPRLLELAKQNATLRPNGEAKLLLAKAYWKANQRDDARRILREVLATPWRTPELAAFVREVRRA
jgi:tetratricopeptide (TPR) repeat protein